MRVRLATMELMQEHIDSLADKLDALSDHEKLALQVVVAVAVEDGEVVGFGQRVGFTEVSGLSFGKVEWVWKAPAGSELMHDTASSVRHDTAKA